MCFSANSEVLIRVCLRAYICYRYTFNFIVAPAQAGGCKTSTQEHPLSNKRLSINNVSVKGGGGGVSQMLTLANKGGGGGQSNSNIG